MIANNGHHILSRKEVVDLEKQSSDSESELIKKAGTEVAKFIKTYYPPCKVLFLIGPGKNGKDGTISAHILKKLGWNITSISINSYIEEIGDLQSYDLIIDAIFGTGLNKELEGNIAKIIHNANTSNKPIIAIDIPSGLNCDTAKPMPNAIKATHTLTFNVLKFCHVLLPALEFCGKIHVLDIGLKLNNVKIQTNSPQLWSVNLPNISYSNNKYSRGTVIIDGSIKYTGATRLAAMSARRIGAGLTIIISHKKVSNIYKEAEAGNIIEEVSTNKDWQKYIINTKANSVIVIGPGTLPSADIRNKIKISANNKKKLVIDAGGLVSYKNKLKEFSNNIKQAKDCVITPHMGEFKQLFPEINNINKIYNALEAAKITGCCIVLKGYDTVIANPDGQCVVMTNNSPNLATAGSGDILSGMIAGLMAQVMPGFFAAAAAVYEHSNIARHCPGLIAEDLLTLHNSNKA